MCVHLFAYRVERSRACCRELVVHHCNKLVDQVSWTQVGGVPLGTNFAKVSSTAILPSTLHRELTFLRISTARTCSFDGAPLFCRLTGFHPVGFNIFACEVHHIDGRVDLMQEHRYTYTGIYSMRATMCCRRTVVYIYAYMYASYPVCI